MGSEVGLGGEQPIELSTDGQVGEVPLLQPRRVLGHGDADALVLARHREGPVRPDPAMPHRDHLDVVAGEQPGHRPGQGRVAEDDHAFDAVTERGAEQEAVGADHGVAGAAAAARFGQQRPVPGLRELAGRRAGVVARHDDGARPEVELDDLPRGRLEGDRPGGRLSHVPVVVRQQRVVELDVEVDRAPVVVLPEEVEQLVEVGRRDVERGREHAEDPDLVGGLVGTGAPQPRGAISGDHDQRHPGVGRLDHRRQEVGDGGAGGADHCGRATADLGQTQREEAGRALVDAGVQSQRAGLRRVVQREGERCVARSGGEDHLAHGGTAQGGDHGAGELGRGVAHAG